MGIIKEWPTSTPKWYLPRRWNVVFLSFWCTTIAYTMRANLSIAIPTMSKEFNWPSSEKGLFLSAFFWGYITTQLLGGMAARKVGPKMVMSFVILVPSLFTLAIPYVASRSAAALVICRVLTGVAAGATFPSLYLMIGKWTPFVERATALSIAVSGSNIGTVITDTIGPVIINHFGWQYVFYATGSIGFIWLIFWTLTVSNSPYEMTNIHPNEAKYIVEENEYSRLLPEKSYKVIQVNVDEKELATPPHSPPNAATVHTPPSKDNNQRHIGNWEALRILGSHRAFWVIVFDGLCLNWGYYIFLTWLPTYVNSELGFNLQISGIIAITPNISGSVVGYISGIICDRMLARGFRLIVVRKMFFLLGSLLYVVTLVLLAYMNELGISPVVAAVILAVGTSGGGLHVPGYSANIFDIAPDHPSIVVGVSNTAATIPGIIGVYSTGLLLQKGAGWTFIWLVTAGFYLIAMIANTLFADVKRIV